MKKLIIGFVVLTACSSPSNQQQTEEEASEQVSTTESLPGNRLHFYRIDNSLKVFMDDSLIYNSGNVADQHDLDIYIDLANFIDDFEILRVELYNGMEPFATTQNDRVWIIHYDLFLDGELADFAHERETNADIGLVFETTYEMAEWLP